MLKKELLEIVVCPNCKGPLDYQYQPEAQPPLEKLICPACRFAYPVVDDIPIMLIDQAERLPEPEAPPGE